MPSSPDDPLSPANKDPAEGADGPSQGGPAPSRTPDHLGEGGDPAEGVPVDPDYGTE